jgi:hypothetical protein
MTTLAGAKSPKGRNAIGDYFFHNQALQQQYQTAGHERIEAGYHAVYCVSLIIAMSSL